MNKPTNFKLSDAAKSLIDGVFTEATAIHTKYIEPALNMENGKTTPLAPVSGSPKMKK
jgi:hypothetical protein